MSGPPRAPRGRPPGPFRAALVAAVALLGTAPSPGRAGVVTRDDLVRWFPAPLVVGEREADLPLWPIFRQGGPPAFATDLAGYVFESADLAPVPGFSGTPPNLLVALDRDGRFLDVRVLSQREPVFVGGLGPEPLDRFVAQYRGLSLEQSVKIGPRSAERGGGSHVHLDGVAKATASVRIVNQSVLAAALRVARARLGFTGGRDPDRLARVRGELFEPLDWRGLVREGLVERLSLRNHQVEAAFAGSEVAGLDAEAAARPEAPFLEIYASLATLPTAGRNLLDDRAWSRMAGRLQPGDHVLLVAWRGRYALVGEEEVRGSVPERLSLSQDGLAIELRDLDLDGGTRPADAPPLDGWRAFRVVAQAGLDPGAPMRLAVRVTRSRGRIHPELVGRDFSLELTVPARFLVPAAGDEKTWRSVWRARAPEIGALVAALAGLALVLARRSPLVSDARRLRWSRPAFLVFTLGFVGWYAQGQLSIVNVTAALQAALAGQGLGFFLHDPMTTILWGFTLATLVAWGRGTFCGWLCPFGALQELAALLARAVGVRAVRVGPETDRRLRAVKYGVLVAVLAAALASPPLGDALVEVEPFKTAITLAFARSWPFVAYAAALVAAGAVVDRLFCRYGCPLGALLALAGRVRRLDWIPRRAECGRPCQTCRHRCAFQAIDPAGRVSYAECFQCMDCVAVHASDTLCTPRVAAARAARKEP